MSAAEVFFVDSNLLLYLVDRTEHVKRPLAAGWINALWTSSSGRLSWQVLNEFYWNATRKMQVSRAEARTLVSKLAEWEPIENSLSLTECAWRWTDSAQLTHWDALILAAAQKAGARYLLSEDFQAGRKYEEIEVLNPFDHSPDSFGDIRVN